MLLVLLSNRGNSEKWILGGSCHAASFPPKLKTVVDDADDAVNDEEEVELVEEQPFAGARLGVSNA